MYQIEGSAQVLKGRGPGAWGSRPRVPRVVLLLGVTSMLTDISSEMVNSVLPLYLILNLHLTPLVFGVIDGLYIGAASLLRLVSGAFADRSRRHKEVAAAGYALSAVSRLGLLVVGGSWAGLAGVILVDRLGKGIRTAPRDAMISLATPRAELATAFGWHRMLDTAGAMVGPLIAFGLLYIAPGAYSTIFVVSLCFGLLGLAVIVLFVQNVPAMIERGERTPRPAAATLRVLRTPGFASLTVIGSALGIATISDGFLYLLLQRRLDLATGFFPLLYVGTALVYMVLALPCGRLADRVGRGAVFVTGYALLLVVYGALLLPSLGPLEVLAFLLLFGAYYAATDGVLMALASSRLPEELRATGLAALTTATTIARLLASVVFGLLWTWRGAESAVMLFAIGLAAATVLAIVVVRGRGGRLDVDITAA